MKSKNFKPLVGNTVTEKAMNTEIVIDVLEEQYGNMTQKNSSHFRSDDEVAKFLKDFATKVCNMAIINSSAPTFEENWKKDFANETWKMLLNQDIKNFIKKTIKEMRSKLSDKIEYSDLFNYSFEKIANHAGLVSRMILHEQHPDLLLLTQDEANEALLKTAKMFKSEGVSTTIFSLNH